MNRDILHIHVPAFAVAVARARVPALRRRPVAVAPQANRGVVLAVSLEARAEGVRRGMLVAQARRVCRGLRLIAPDPERIEAAQTALLDLVRRYTPLWEIPRPGHLFMDLTGGGRLFGPSRDVAARLEREVKAGLGAAGSVGVGGNKLISRVASQFLAEGGVCDVLRGSETAFLAPLPIDLLPGLGRRRRQLLLDWNLQEIGEIPAVPAARLEAVLGPFGRVLRGQARGEDWEPVRLPVERPSVAASETLPGDEADDGVVLGHLRALVGEVCSRLRAEGRVAGRVEVRLRYADGADARKQGRLAPPTFWDHEVFPRVRDLFSSACRRRVRVRWVGVTLSGLAAAVLQQDLFRALQRDPSRESLCRALDEIRSRHGFASVRWGGAGFLRPGASS